MLIRPATTSEDDSLWRILEPVIREGETIALPRDAAKPDVLAFWGSPGNEVFVADDDGQVVGTYFIRANQKGGGGHVANCGYATGYWATGKGVARAMCQHSIERAKSRGFRSVQFNFVVSTNERAVKLWQSFGFETVGRLPGAFHHPAHGYVDALVMFLNLETNTPAV